MINLHSGKQLNDVPIDDISVGMEVMHVVRGHHVPGKVTSIVPPVFIGKGHYINIDWQDGNFSYDDHGRFNDVKVF